MNAFPKTALLRGIAMFGLAVGLCAAAQAQTITTIAGSGAFTPLGDGGPATAAGLFAPSDVVVDGAGNRYIADTSHFRIRKVTPGGVISTVAGNGTSGFSGDGGAATSANIGYVYQLAVDGAGNLYFADYLANRIRKVTPAGIITTIAGTGVGVSAGDGGPATAASFRGPVGVALDGAGNLYVGEYSGQRIRRIVPAGTISTIAGTGAAGFSGDGGPATAAMLGYPFGMVVDGAGNLLVAESDNHRIRRITPAGIISTVAGNGGSAFAGDGGAATSAAIGVVTDVAADAAGNLYIAGLGQDRVRKVSPSGVIRTFAGNGVHVDSGDGGAAVNASLRGPYGIVAAADKLYVTTTDGNRVRMVSPLFSSCVAEGYSGTQLILCKQVCESHYPITTVNALIRAWLTLYHYDPPCAP